MTTTVRKVFYTLCFGFMFRTEVERKPWRKQNNTTKNTDGRLTKEKPQIWGFFCALIRKY